MAVRILSGHESKIELGVLVKPYPANDGGLAQFEIAVRSVRNLTNGTGAGQANLAISDGDRSIALSSSESLDLAGGAPGEGLGGATVTFTSVKEIYVKAADGNTNNLIIGNGATPFIGPFGAAGASEIILQPGEEFFWKSSTGRAVTAASGDLLKFANSGAGTAVEYDLVIVGVGTVA